MAKYKRLFTGSDNRRRQVNPGKGSDRREAQVSEEQIARNWCRTFGHRVDYDDWCVDCRMTYKQIEHANEFVRQYV